MNKTKAQRRKEAKKRRKEAERRHSALSEKPKTTVSLPMPIVKRAVNQNANKTDGRPKEEGEEYEDKQSKIRKTYPMSAVLSLIFVSVLSVIAFAFAFHYWQQDNLAVSLRWGFITYVFIGLGIAFAIKYYVIEPRETAKKPLPPEGITERARLTALDFVLSVEPQINKESTVKYSVVIAGTTPAFDVTLQSQAYIWHNEPPRFEPGPLNPALGPVSRGTMYPGVGPSINYTTPYIFPPASIAAYRSKKSMLYVQVLINYKDSLQRPHWTRVCAWHIFGAPLNHFTHCEHNNETDEDEKKN